MGCICVLSSSWGDAHAHVHQVEYHHSPNNTFLICFIWIKSNFFSLSKHRARKVELMLFGKQTAFEEVHHKHPGSISRKHWEIWGHKIFQWIPRLHTYIQATCQNQMQRWNVKPSWNNQHQKISGQGNCNTTHSIIMPVSSGLGKWSPNQTTRL